MRYGDDPKKRPAGPVVIACEHPCPKGEVLMIPPYRFAIERELTREEFQREFAAMQTDPNWEHRMVTMDGSMAQGEAKLCPGPDPDQKYFYLCRYLGPMRPDGRNRMTDNELQGIATQALNIVKTEMELKGHGARPWLIGAYDQGKGLRRFSKVENTIVQHYGEDWLNHPKKKKEGFEALRMCVNLSPPHALVIVTQGNFFQPTEAFKKLDKKQQKAIMDAGHPRHHQGVAEGLFTLKDVLISNAQTADRVCILTQVVERGALIGPPRVDFCDQRELGGHLKMFGIWERVN